MGYLWKERLNMLSEQRKERISMIYPDPYADETLEEIIERVKKKFQAADRAAGVDRDDIPF